MTQGCGEKRKRARKAISGRRERQQIEGSHKAHVLLTPHRGRQRNRTLPYKKITISCLFPCRTFHALEVTNNHDALIEALQVNLVLDLLQDVALILARHLQIWTP